MKFLRVISLMAVIASVVGYANKADANITQDLTANYNKVVKNCGSDDKPAYLCSGNLIRFTTNDHNYLPWEAPPTSYQKGIGVSFFYTRRDVNTKVVFNGKFFGVIYYPPLIRPQGKLEAKFLCAFPIDGVTADRVNGCGAHPAYPNDSIPCQDQGIYTADGWYKQFTSIEKEDWGTNWTRATHQCGFDIKVGTANRADIFNQMLQAQKKAKVEEGEWDTFFNFNELIMNLWVADSKGHISNAQDLPIQAFFYTTDTNGNSGLADARFFQQRYYDLNNHIIIPIVKITQDSSFSKVYYVYNSADQQVSN